MSSARQMDALTNNASRLAELAKSLEKSGHAPDAVATFLMRCLFTMFSEDVRLLPDKLFQKALREHWLPNPKGFPIGIETLWRAMFVRPSITAQMIRFIRGNYREFCRNQ
jgi:hypothetical protein